MGFSFAIPIFPKRTGDIMRKMRNLKGLKFGKLTAICPVGKNNKRSPKGGVKS
nr:MAG TPA: hypothetical protein [Caudoviricetes sp.]